MIPPAKICGLAAIVFLSAFVPHGLKAWEPLKVHPQNPHIMEFRGKPQVLYTVAEHYGSVINRDFDYIPYLNIMKRDGMNLTRIFLAGFRHDNRVPANDPLAPTPAAFLQPWKRSTAGGNALDGLGKWDFTQWDEAYFARLRSFMQECSDRGIVVELTFFSTFYTNGEWRNSPFNPANNAQEIGPPSRYDSLRPVDTALMAAKEEYVRKVVREVNQFDNFYFEIHNEPFWNEPGIKDDQEVAFHNRMLEVIREEEALLPNQHLVAHNFPQQTDALSGDFEIINDHYPTAVPGTTLAGADALLRDQYSRSKILGMGEADTETEPQVRLETWMFLTGGGAIYNGLAFINTIYTTDNEAGDSEFGNASRGSIRKAAKFINTLDLVSLRRDLSWVRGGIPVGATLQAMANPGQQHVAYFHHGKGGLVNFQLSYNPIDDTDHQIAPVVRLEEGTWRATWTRPSDLATLATEEFVHSGGDKILAPVTYQADVALRIDRTGEGDLTPPPPPSRLIAAPVADGSIRLTWIGAEAADVASHRIYRAEASGLIVGPSQLLAEVSESDEIFIDLSTSVNDTFFYLITAVDTNGNESAPCDEASATAALQNLPYLGTPHAIPGIIQSEDFDRGGQDIAYNDVTPDNEGALYREAEAVDIEATTDDGGGHHIFATMAGEWLEYTVNVAESGVYRMDFRASNAAAGGEMFLEVNGTNVSGAITIPEPNGEQTWQTVAVPESVFSAGVQVIRLVVTQTAPGLTAGAINWMEFTPVSKISPTANAGPDQTIMDDNFDGYATTVLDASGSAAGDAPIFSFSWALGSQVVATGVAPEISLPLGTHILKLTTTNTHLLTSTDEVRIQVNPGGFNNGSFEENLNSWTATGNVIVTSSAPYTFPAGNKIVAFNNDQSEPGGILSQTFATIPGQIYQLRFDMGVLAFNNFQQSLQVQVTGSTSLLSQTFTINRLNGVIVRWESKSLQFTANSTFTTLTFRDLSTETDSLDLTLDNIHVIQQISRTLVVNSSPATGAGITINPPDNSGQASGSTDLTRNYPNAVAVTLTAATTNAGASFSRWQKDGIDLGHNPILNILMDRDHTVTAIYVEGLPLVTAQPTNTAIAAGATATFQVTATSSNPMTYQWRLNGIPMVDEHSPTLIISNVQTVNTGSYDVVVTSVIGSVTSSAATLSLMNTASLINGSFETGFDGWTRTGNLSVQSGAPYTATAGTKLVAFNGAQKTPNGVLSQSFGTTPGQSYQLVFDMGVFAYNNAQQRLQVELTGSSSLISQTYVTNRINGINVRWEAKSLLFTAKSGTTTLTFRDLSATTDSLDLTLDNVRIIPQITRVLSVQSTPATGAAITVSPPDNGGLGNGITGFARSYPNTTSVSLTAAQFSGGLRFLKWQRSGADLATTPNVNVVMDANHTLTAVYVEGLPVITEQPLNTAVTVGGSATIQVTAEGSGTLSYQWRFNGNNLTNEIADTLIIADVQPDDAGSYDVIVSNAAGPVTSNAAVLSVPTAPVGASLVNGSFESGFAGWTTTGNLSIQSGSPYAATDGSKQVAFNSGQLTPNGVLSQAFITTPGQTYQLVFDMGVVAFNDSQQRLRIEVNGSSSLVSQTFVTNRSNGAVIRWDSRTILFTANSSVTTLIFRDLSSVTDSLDLTLDNVRIISQVNRNLTVQASGSANVAVTVIPADRGGLSSGTTSFTRIYPNSTTVNLSAPILAGGFRFSKWQRNGVDLATTSAISLLMDGDHTLTAVYTAFTPGIPAGIKIMPLGDSITYGFHVTNAGYRGPLFSLLSPDAQGFQFVGTQTQFPGNLPASPIDQRQHQGMPGYNIQDIANNLDGLDSTRFLALGGSDKNPAGGHWLTGGGGTGRQPLFPDVITLMIGASDMQILTGSESRLRNLLTKITTLRPATRLFVAKITANTVYPSESAAYNASVTSLVAEFRAAGKNIYLVDLNSGFPANGLADGVHPNSAGSSWMAQQWRDAIVASYPAIDPNGQPVITDHPDSATVPAGGSATFEVTAVGATPLTYQWRFNSTPISGATSRTLTITNVQAANAGSYDVVITNASGTATSNPAQLALLSSATIVNGSFESGLDGWTHTGNLQARTASATYTATNGTRLIAFNHANLQPNGVISQTISTTPGATYTLAFDVGVLAYNTLQQQMQVTATGQTVVLSRNITVIGLGNGTTRWVAQSFTFVADSSSTVLAFRDISTTSNGLDLLLDNVRMTIPGSPTAAPGMPAPTLMASIVPVTVELPTLGSASLDVSPGRITVSFNAPDAGTYKLEKSPDLLRWEPAGEVQVEEPGLIEFNDVSSQEDDTPPAARMFYRIARPPEIGIK